MALFDTTCIHALLVAYLGAPQRYRSGDSECHRSNADVEVDRHARVEQAPVRGLLQREAVDACVEV